MKGSTSVVSEMYDNGDAVVASSGSVIGPSVLAEVFEESPLPFATNSDGSVNRDTYLRWLSETWVAGMEAFETLSAPAPIRTSARRKSVESAFNDK